MMTVKQGVAVLFGIAVLMIVVQEARLRGAERRLVTASLVRDSLVAVHDTTRMVSAGEVIGGDSVRLWEQRAVQATERADALDRALGEARVAQVEVRVATAQMDTTVAMPEPGGEQVVRQAPYTLSIERPATRSADSASAIGVRIVSDTLKLGMRIGCGAPGRLGVRSASVSVSAPTWASVALDQVEQDPSVCNVAVVSVVRGGVIGRLLGRVGVTVGYSALVADGGVVLRPTVGIGVKIWP